MDPVVKALNLYGRDTQFSFGPPQIEEVPSEFALGDGVTARFYKKNLSISFNRSRDAHGLDFPMIVDRDRWSVEIRGDIVARNPELKTELKLLAAVINQIVNEVEDAPEAA